MYVRKVAIGNLMTRRTDGGETVSTHLIFMYFSVFPSLYTPI